MDGKTLFRRPQQPVQVCPRPQAWLNLILPPSTALPPPLLLLPLHSVRACSDILLFSLFNCLFTHSLSLSSFCSARRALASTTIQRCQLPFVRESQCPSAPPPHQRRSLNHIPSCHPEDRLTVTADLFSASSLTGAPTATMAPWQRGRPRLPPKN